MELEEIRDRAAGRRLDLLVGIDEGQRQLGRQAPADRGLAGAHQADEDDAAVEQGAIELGDAGGLHVRWYRLENR